MVVGACMLVALAVGFHSPSLPIARQAPSVSRVDDVLMLNLFGNNEESKARREALSYRQAQTGDRKVTFRKPNQATDGLVLGLKFREGVGKAVYIDKIIENTEAARLKQQQKIREGDEVTMVSATFGDEMWSARGVGKYRLEKSIAVRQGMTISFVVENRDDFSEKRMRELAEAQKKEAEKISRLQKMMTQEVDAEKKKGPFGLW